MEKFKKPIWTFLDGYLVSTKQICDHQLQTMVFPAKKDAREIKGLFTNWVKGVDFEAPYEEYTRKYSNFAEARIGHWGTVKKLRNKIRKEKK